MRVLIIEDDPSIVQAIKLFFESENIICDFAELGEKGLEMATFHPYDIIILDLMLPDIDGYKVLLKLRSDKVKAPILILSGIASEDNKIKCLNSGADDYVTKPFNKDELIARMDAIIRRSKGHSVSMIRFGKISINLDTRRVEIGGNEIHLTNKEYAILELLAMRKDMVITKEMFHNHLYGGKKGPNIKIVDVFVCKLRTKMAQLSGGTDYIETVWGRGYMLKSFELEALPNSKEMIGK